MVKNYTLDMEQEFLLSQIHMNLRKRTLFLKTILSVYLVLVNISQLCSVRDEISFDSLSHWQKTFCLISPKFCFFWKVGFRVQGAINKMYLKLFICCTHDLKDGLIILHSFSQWKFTLKTVVNSWKWTKFLVKQLYIH